VVEASIEMMMRFDLWSTDYAVSPFLTNQADPVERSLIEKKDSLNVSPRRDLPGGPINSKRLT
jgi:hypothetical protein